MSNRNHDLGILVGVLSTLGINFLLFIFLIAYLSKNTYLSQSTFGPAFIFGISVYQLIYVVPAIIWLKQRQHWGTMKGVIIAAVTTALLTGPCFVVFLANSL
jgi:hypothetical protein